MKKVFGLIILTLVGITGAWGWVLSSHPYKEARKIILTDTDIKEEYGVLSNIILCSAKIRYGDVNKGDFTFYLVGQKKTGLIKVKSEQTSGRWSVNIAK